MTAYNLRMGEILVAHGALSRSDLEAALAVLRARLGDFLLAHGLVDGRNIARACAAQQRLRHVNLIEEPPDTALFSPRDRQHYISYRFIPYARSAQIITLATTEPDKALRQFARKHYGCEIELCVATARDLSGYLTSRGATSAARCASLSLRRRYRHLVADRIMIAPQLRGLFLLLAAMALVAFTYPADAWKILLVACNLFYLFTLAIKLEFYRQGSAANREQGKHETTLKQALATLHNDELPLYSILVPLYGESEQVMARLIASLNAIDYPKEKLDIKLICEADDVETLRALKSLHPPQTMEIIAVPPSLPRTKPKACNVALSYVRGEYTVIYDAEDAPAPDQLKRACIMFRDGSENLACLQASLGYYNRNENILTQLFSIEYSALFSLLLPGLERMRLPIPLGGTSNHLKTAALRAVGGWDAFNVTEDADLGIRLHYFGYKTCTLPSLTLEESPIALGAWMKQRTRWIKGYIQTWLVYMRDSGELKRRLGRFSYYGFQFFIGAPAITFLLAPIFWATFIVSLLGLLGEPLSPPLQVMCAISFIGGALGNWLFARKVMQLEGWEYMRRAFMLYPLYWLLHSAAAGRALWQLITAPHYWDKTRHGVSTIVRGKQAINQAEIK